LKAHAKAGDKLEVEAKVKAQNYENKKKLPLTLLGKRLSA
jgi:hypothetical protein